MPQDDTPTLLHKQEMVLPAYLAQRVRDAAERAGSADRRETHGPSEIRVRFDPVVLRYPDGSTQTVYPRVDPFDGIIDHPIGGGF